MDVARSVLGYDSLQLPLYRDQGFFEIQKYLRSLNSTKTAASSIRLSHSMTLILICHFLVSVPLPLLTRLDSDLRVAR